MPTSLIQALLHDKFQNMEEACSLWSSLTTAAVTDTHFPGPEFFARKLGDMPTSLVWAHVDALLSVDQATGVSVLTRHRDGTQDAFVERALATLGVYKAGRRLYLEELVFR